MNKKKYGFIIDGCHDSTYFEIEMTENEANVADLISRKSQEASKYGCQPIIDFWEIKEK